MMRLLTGSKSSSSSSPSSSTDTSFEFTPKHTTSFGPTVIAEGCDHSGQISWVHAWTVTDGIITQVREYFNTSLTVTRIGPPSSSSDCSPRSSTSSAVEINSVHCPSVWESSFSNRVGKSVPGLVLAI
ncbi:hypothetical protein Ddye_031623 [Dipteronia dyeriana]|uniref:Wound-induced protein 1 n=1 Tax=Dipteronia dyeriana TaxID=168575 RepID=A0AAD9TJB4_9ROSI|nr:hypothetical protein Ddye_031623 [Dipteronia dyeriana]